MIRDQEIFTAFTQGRSFDELAANYGLTPDHVEEIIRAERTRREVSPERVYRELRQQPAG
jgi:Mor family transcriptional regulator